MDTIYALATARGRAGVAVIRISGPRAWEAASSLAGALPEPRHSAVRRLTWNGETIDEALVLIFNEGHSFTGERVAEFQLHGSIAIVGAVFSALGSLPGLRPAVAGEFTRRALENGRLDLTQVEGLADLIDAETEAQRRQAMRVFSGAIGSQTNRWRADLIRAAALLEATIDFVDEDVPVDVAPEVTELVGGVLADIRHERGGIAISERIRDGFEVAIVGLPNAGKSTLLNALAGREAALTSEYAGTTRDIIEVRMDLDGLPVTLLDTAGLRETTDVVETMGVERAIKRAKAADLRIFLLSEGMLPIGLIPGGEDVVVAGKADLGSSQEGVSGLTGQGLDELITQISGILQRRAVGASTMTRERHRIALLSAQEALESALVEVDFGSVRTELAAEDLRRAIRALETLVGRIDVEDLLDEIFSSFCIGK